MWEREVKAIKEMYDTIKTSVNMDCIRSESFEVKIGVHQGSILSPLLFAIVMDEVTRDIREGVVKELLYADDLILLGNSWEEVESRYDRWKKAPKNHGLKINVNKTKGFYTGGKVVRMQIRKFPCSVCGNGVGRNSLQCTKCQYWVHKKCSGIQGKVASMNGFVCKRCLGVVATSTEENVTLDKDNIEIVDKFAYLRDVLSMKGRA